MKTQKNFESVKANIIAIQEIEKNPIFIEKLKKKEVPKGT